MPSAPRKRPPRTGPRSESALLIRLTEAEHEEIRAAAAAEATPPSVWARSRLLLAARVAAKRMVGEGSP